MLANKIIEHLRTLLPVVLFVIITIYLLSSDNTIVGPY